jgi:hypothetical protein
MASADDYRRVDLGGAAKAEYGQVNPTDTYPATRTDQVPSPAPSRQFASDHSGDPESLAADSMDSQNAFSELQQFLNNSLETPGSRVCHDQTKPYRPPQGAEGE